MKNKKVKVVKKRRKGIIETITRNFKEVINPSRVFYVRIFQPTGEPIGLVVTPKDNTFLHKEATYIIKDSCKYYDPLLKEWCFDYYHNCPLPIEYKLENAETQDALLVQTVDSFTLTKVIKSTVIQQFLGSDELMQGIGFIKIVVVVSALLQVGMVIALMKLGGLF